MKKFFKSPDLAKVKGHKALIKALKSVLKKAGDGAYKFFYKASFDYKDEEAMPFLYIGNLAGPWKIYCKTVKKDPDFAAGICKLETDERGVEKLLLCVEKGKGGKPIFLKTLNKEILRRVGVLADFVDVIEAPIVEEVEDLEEEEEGFEQEEETDEEALAANAGIGINLDSVNDSDKDDNDPVVNPKEHVEAIKKIVADFKELQQEFEEEKLDALIEEIDEWHDNHESLAEPIRNKLSKVAEQAMQVKVYLKKVASIDKKLEEQLEEAAEYLEEWHEIDDEVDALILEKLILSKVGKIEKIAALIKDKAIIGYCDQLKKAFA